MSQTTVHIRDFFDTENQLKLVLSVLDDLNDTFINYYCTDHFCTLQTDAQDDVRIAHKEFNRLFFNIAEDLIGGGYNFESVEVPGIFHDKSKNVCEFLEFDRFIIDVFDRSLKYEIEEAGIDTFDRKTSLRNLLQDITTQLLHARFKTVIADRDEARKALEEKLNK